MRWLMGRYMIVSRMKKLQEYKEIAKEYDVSFEINDFYEPEILDDEDRQRAVIEAYHKIGIPNRSTLHGAFCDIVVFSHDERIREISKMRMEQSIQFAKALGLEGVVFHTNYNLGIQTEEYFNHFLDATAEYLSTLLERNPDINIYVENMFDTTPYALRKLSERLAKYENYGVCLDWSHAHVYGSEIHEWVECLKPYVKHIHINDNDLTSDLHLPVGSGKIDWNQFWDYYNKYFNYCSVLIETNEPDNQRKSLEYMKTLKRKVNVMEHKQSLTAEEMLNQIFYYMNKLVEEKDFGASTLLLTDLGRTLVNAERASFWYRDKRNKQYWTMAASGTDRIVVEEGKGIIGASIENDETILISEPYEDKRFNSQVDKDTGFVTKSILCMPVKNSTGEVIGAYQAINKLGDDMCFDEQDKERLALAAAYCGKTLETHILKMQSQLDHLTGLKNRRGFYDCYENKITPCLQSQGASVILCDIDYFKKVNDTYGHNAGDEVLVMVADLMQKYVAEAGEVFRWGGEEFIILLPKYDLDKAAILAEKIRRCVQEAECHSEGTQIKVTMSFGVKELEKDKAPDLNVKEVDAKLYEAKQSGRNRVVV